MTANDRTVTFLGSLFGALRGDGGGGGDRGSMGILGMEMCIGSQSWSPQAGACFGGEDVGGAAFFLPLPCP